MANPQMYELSPKALAFMRESDSRYSQNHRTMAGMALRGGDPQLLTNPHLGDYADILLQPPLVEYFAALIQMADANPQVSAMARDRINGMSPELQTAIQRLYTEVQQLHTLDAIADGKIPNKSFVKGRLVPLITGSSN